MKNITVAVPDEVYREARIRAAERGASVSTLVAEFLREMSGEGAEFSRLEAQQCQIYGSIGAFRAGDRLSRDEVHERSLR